MKGRKVFEGIRLFATEKPLFKVIGCSEKTQGQWQRILAKELKQENVFSAAIGSWILKKHVFVKWVVGDVVGIEIWMHDTSSITSAHSPKIMYVNATGLDLIFDNMRQHRGRELEIFAESYNKNFHEAYQAAVLIIGWIQRTDDKKKKYQARREWRKLMKCHTEEKQREIISIICETIQDSEAKNELLSWRTNERI
jgi:hypothetical protein